MERQVYPLTIWLVEMELLCGCHIHCLNWIFSADQLVEIPPTPPKPHPTRLRPHTPLKESRRPRFTDYFTDRISEAIARISDST